jgi:hypothetical protein
MTELQVLDLDRIDEAIAEYIQRCDILLHGAFFASETIRGEFRDWIVSRFRDGDKLMLLHDAPISAIGRFLGKKASAHIVERATKISIENGWTRV